MLQTGLVLCVSRIVNACSVDSYIEVPMLENSSVLSLIKFEFCSTVTDRLSGPSCSKLTTSLVNVSLISNINITNTLLFFVEKM